MTSPDLAPLENLAKIGKLKAEPSDERESKGLIRSATVRLHDARNSSLSLESRFDLAYNAAHSAALAALRGAGFRSDNRYLVFQCLAHTLNLPAAEWVLLNQAHTKRNLAEYEGDLDVTDSFVAELIEQVEAVLQAIKAS